MSKHAVYQCGFGKMCQSYLSLWYDIPKQSKCIICRLIKEKNTIQPLLFWNSSCLVELRHGNVIPVERNRSHWLDFSHNNISRFIQLVTYTPTGHLTAHFMSANHAEF